MIDYEKFYSYYSEEEENNIAKNEDLFMDFIESLMNFTDELEHSPLVLSGIKYANSNIILKQTKNYHILFFIGNLDITNYDFVDKILEEKSREMYDIVKYDVNPHVLSEGLNELLSEIFSDIPNRFDEIRVDESEL